MLTVKFWWRHYPHTPITTPPPHPTHTNSHTHTPSQIQNFYTWNINVEKFIIFPSRYMLALLSVMKTQAGIENSFFSYAYDCNSHLKMVDDISQTIFVATINWCAWRPSRMLRLLLMSKLLVANLSRFCTNKNIYFAFGNTWLLISISMIQHHRKIIICRYFTHISTSRSDGQDLSNICLVAAKNNTVIIGTYCAFANMW